MKIVQIGAVRQSADRRVGVRLRYGRIRPACGDLVLTGRNHTQCNGPIQNSCGRRSLTWILGLTALVVGGLAIGGFVLPDGWQRSNAAQNCDDPQANVVTQPAPETDPDEERPAEISKIAQPATAPVNTWPGIDDSTTLAPSPGGPVGELVNLIDRRIDERLKRENLVSSAPATDAEFHRRVYLDLHGRIPPYEKTIAFLHDRDVNKRARLVDELLDHESFGKHFATIWADLLIKRDADTNRNLNAEPFIDWLAKQFNENRGWDAIVSELISASGKVGEHPATFFTVANQDNNAPAPAKLVAATTNLFMGLQLQCAECHVHPTVDSWTQQDFWGMAAFFGHVQFERTGDKAPRAPISAVKEVARQAEPKGKVGQKLGIKAIATGDSIPIPDPTDAKKTTGTAKAKFFEAAGPANLGTQTPFRPKLAAWLTAPDNRYFARASVNRLWAHLFAKGIIDPVEDMGPASTASHPELLDELASAFVAQKFDTKHLLRAYCNSQAYNRTSKPTDGNRDDESFLSHMPIKVIGARELLDSLTIATGNRPSREAGRAPREKGPAKGVQAPATGVRFFDNREYEDSVLEFSYGIPQMLKQMNTGMTNNVNVANRFGRTGREPAEVIVDLYVAILARRPRGNELDRLVPFVEHRSDRSAAYQDIAWALLNSAEFVSNH